jgi:hypothetical protein
VIHLTGGHENSNALADSPPLPGHAGTDPSRPIARRVRNRSRDSMPKLISFRIQAARMSAGSVGFCDVHAICDFLRQPGTHCPCFPQTAALTPMRSSSGHAPPDQRWPGIGIFPASARATPRVTALRSCCRFAPGLAGRSRLPAEHEVKPFGGAESDGSQHLQAQGYSLPQRNFHMRPPPSAEFAAKRTNMKKNASASHKTASAVTAGSEIRISALARLGSIRYVTSISAGLGMRYGLSPEGPVWDRLSHRRNASVTRQFEGVSNCPAGTCSETSIAMDQLSDGTNAAAKERLVYGGRWKIRILNLVMSSMGSASRIRIAATSQDISIPTLPKGYAQDRSAGGMSKIGNALQPGENGKTIRYHFNR